MSAATGEARSGGRISAAAPRSVFRVVAVVEALTWSLLLVGMYLKYVSGTTEVLVSVGGMLHGIAFVAYGVVTVAVAVDARWSLRRTVLVLLAAVPPLVTVVADLVLERRRALPRAWRLRAQRPSGAVERAVALAVRHPVRGATTGVALVAVLTLLALAVGPPVGG